MRKTFIGFKLTYTPGSLFKGERPKLELQAPPDGLERLVLILRIFDGHVGMGDGCVDLSPNKFYVLANPGPNDDLEVVLRPRYEEVVIMYATPSGIEIETYGRAEARFRMLFSQ